jgi:dTDP-4-amino-4,6-dideoxygalactose transaminase
LAKDPQKLAATLRQSGFDATHKSSLQIVQSTENNPNSETQIAGNILDQVVFLPLYPEMPLTEFKRMVGYIRNPENKEHENQHEARD